MCAVPQSFDLSASNFRVEGAAAPEKLTKAAVAMKIKNREPSGHPDETSPKLKKPEGVKGRFARRGALKSYVSS